MTIVGVISDTHGVLRPAALEALRGAKLILHAGDIGSAAVIDGLKEAAPVIAVRGNCDHGTLAARFPTEQKLTVAGINILILHDRTELRPLQPDERVRVVVTGHTHKPSIEEKDGILYLNPGSAGRKRFSLPITLALLKIEDGEVKADIVKLEP